MNEELKKNRGTLKKLQKIIKQVKLDDPVIYKDDFGDTTLKLLEEAVVRISRLEKGLQYLMDTFIDDNYGKHLDEMDEYKWVKSLLEPVDDHNNSS